jgi:RNA polymerase sigma-70 factor (ECF subfamily)
MSLLSAPRPEPPCDAGGARATHDPDDFGAALCRLRGALMFRALQLTRDREAAEDLVQQTFERALAARFRFRRGTNLRGWVLSIQRNLFIDGYRHGTHSQRLEAEPPAPPADEPQEPSAVLSSDDLRVSLAALPARTQELIALAYFEKVPRPEIARRLGVAPSTIGTRLFRARARLRRQLEALYQARVCGAEVERCTTRA